MLANGRVANKCDMDRSPVSLFRHGIQAADDIFRRIFPKRSISIITDVLNVVISDVEKWSLQIIVSVTVFNGSGN
jgi:hypothetical protein